MFEIFTSHKAASDASSHCHQMLHFIKRNYWKDKCEKLGKGKKSWTESWVKT